MTTMDVMDDTTLADRLEAQTRAALALADMITNDPTEQAAALITAATAIIQREVGVAMAPSAFMALAEPTLAAWQSVTAGTA